MCTGDTVLGIQGSRERSRPARRRPEEEVISHADYPTEVIDDVVRMRRRLAGVPTKVADRNLLIASWNIRMCGGLHPEFGENGGSPKRNLRALAVIAEVVRRFDVVAIQEVRRETTAIRSLVDDFLGTDWGLILTDVCAGSAGNSERLSFIFDRRRIRPSGLAGEVVLPPTTAGDPLDQFDRTPYIVGFEAGATRFSLVTAHIKYGDTPALRVPELQAFADFTANELRDRARVNDREIGSVLTLGDFNIDTRGDNPLFNAFVSKGLVVPEQLQGLKTTAGGTPKFYDQIAWFMGSDMRLQFTRNAGVVNFEGAVFKELTTQEMTFRVSDHFPLWVEFQTDQSATVMAIRRGLNPDSPDPFASIPD
jgi:endonuclease/exonuclease/phosphatase family metal-dependent hydrolase